MLKVYLSMKVYLSIFKLGMQGVFKLQSIFKYEQFI